MSTRFLRRWTGGVSLRRGLCFVLTAALWIALFSPRSSAADANPPSKEYQLKAAFLYNFTKFVDWPPGRFASPDSPIVIGILGENPFGSQLETIVSGRKVNGRAIVVRMVTTAEEAASVHILFVVANQGEALRPMLDSLRRSSVLTVGESPEFAALGGVITFVLDGDKIRFTINLSSGKRAGLDIRAQLLSLASHVQTGD